MKQTIQLTGCAPIPLAHYLKALGVLRLIAEQTEPDVTGFWRNDVFILQSDLDDSSMISFFLEKYRPTPVLAPWNGGSGFFPKDNQDSLKTIECAESVRFETYGKSIAVARRLIADLQLKEKPTPEQKENLLSRCRNEMPEAVLPWLDAVYSMSNDGPKYPPLLGTGGNDGRLEFTNNFMQRVLEVIHAKSGESTNASRDWLLHSLFGTNMRNRVNAGPVGQFFPGAAGGANATSGFDAPSSVNPWDFILMIEGAVLFASATTKKLESSEQGSNLMYPFCVRQAGAGYPSAAIADETHARAEMWMPLWHNSASLPEINAIFSEGRAQVGGRTARNGTDFARAVMTFGVDRGLYAFQRYGFQVRNGLAYFATPLDRFVVQRNARVDLLSEIDPWLDRFRSKAGPHANPTPPASISGTLNRLESRIMALCKSETPENTQSVLIALGRCESTMTRSLRWTTENGLRPISGLSPRWIRASYDNTPEFRLALALASLTGVYNRETLAFRRHLEPVAVKGSRDQMWFDWLDNPSSDVIPQRSDFAMTLNAIFARRLIRMEQAGLRRFPDTGERLPLADIAGFIEETTNDLLIEDLLWGLSLINWWKVETHDLPELAQEKEFAPSVFYALLKLCFCRSDRTDETIPPTPAIHRRAMNGDAKTASSLAAQRLFASGLGPAVRHVDMIGRPTLRAAAALIFPLKPDQIDVLRRSVLRTKKPETIQT